MPVTVIEDTAPSAAVATTVRGPQSIEVYSHPGRHLRDEHGHGHHHGHGHQEDDHCCEHDHQCVHEHGHEHGHGQGHEHGHGQGHEHGHGECDEDEHASAEVHNHAEAHNHAHVPRIVKSRSVTVSIVGTLVLFLALTLHSFLAGLVLGLDVSAKGAGLFFAIIAHKSFAAWALGCALARTDRAQLSFCAALLSLTSFALTTPSGVLIGLAISSADVLDSKVQATLVALAAGFFLYVGLMELVGKELIGYRTTGSGVFAALKLVMLVLGFALMALLALWV